MRAPSLASRANGETSGLLRIAGPLALSNLGNQFLGVVATAIVGRLGEVELGAVGLGNAIYFGVAVVGLGLMLGIDPLVSQALGAGEPSRARSMFHQGTYIALLVALPLSASVVGIVLSLEPLGIEPAAARATAAYVWAKLPSLLPFLVLVGGRTYLAARSITRPMVIGVIVANVVNAPLGWALVFGDAGLADAGLSGLGIPALGIAGAGLSGTACTVIQCAIVIAAVRWSREPALTGVSATFDLAAVARALRLGAPIAGALLAEVGVFALTGFVAGLLGTRPLAAHNVALTLASTAFQVPLALGAAASVRVGHAVGRSDPRGTRHAGLVAFLAVIAFMGTMGLLFVAIPAPLARLLTNDGAVVAAAVPLVLVAAAFQLVDGVQAVGAGVLRGIGDTRFSLVANIVGHYAIGMPVAVLLTWPLGFGVVGLWWGLCAGLTAVAIALAVRFHRRSSQVIGRS